MFYSTRRFLLCLTLCYFVLVFFSPFSIAITSLGKRASLGAFRAFVRFVFVWFCLFPLPLGAWEGLRFEIVALPGIFSSLFLEQSVMNYLRGGEGGREDLWLALNNRCLWQRPLSSCDVSRISDRH